MNYKIILPILCIYLLIVFTSTDSKIQNCTKVDTYSASEVSLSSDQYVVGVDIKPDVYDIYNMSNKPIEVNGVEYDIEELQNIVLNKNTFLDLKGDIKLVPSEDVTYDGESSLGCYLMNDDETLNFEDTTDSTDQSYIVSVNGKLTLRITRDDPTAKIDVKKGDIVEIKATSPTVKDLKIQQIK